MNITINAAAANFTFTPVAVSRGRKFRGMAYSLGYGECARAVAWNVTSYSVKLWDPTTKRYVYSNPDFVEDRAVSPEQLAADKQAYAEHVIMDTITWCRSRKAGATDDEVLRFARNVLRKHHPEMLDLIDSTVPDTRDVVAEVQKTLQWAMTLKTQACWMYGHYCAGGKPVSDERKIRSAYKALCKKGINKLDGFNEVWQMTIDVMGLPHIQL